MTRILRYQEAIREAYRFIQKAQNAIEPCLKNEELVYGKDNAAAIRASLDLTNALANLRKSDYN